MKPQKRISLMLCLSLALLLTGCGLLQPQETAKTEDAELPLESLFRDESAMPTPTPPEAIYYDYSDYRNVLENTEAEFAETMGGDYLLYGLCDLDGDGVLELLVMEGTCEADYIWRVYTVSETGAKDVGSFGGSHSLLYTDDEEGALCLHGIQGHEEIDRITYDGEYLTVRNVITQDLAVGEEHTVPGTPVATAPISDPGLIP